MNIDFDDRRPKTTDEDEPRRIDDVMFANDSEQEADRRRAIVEIGFDEPFRTRRAGVRLQSANTVVDTGDTT